MHKTLGFVLIVLAAALVACGGPPATPAPATPAAPVEAPSPTPEPTPTSEPTATPAPAATPTPAPTPEPPATEMPLVGDHDAEDLMDEHAAEDLMDEHAADDVVPEPSPVPQGSAPGPGWTRLEPANAGPDARYNHALAYHPASRQVFVFGGRDGSRVFDDAWALDLDSSTWRQLAADSAARPPARHTLVMMVDPAGQHLYVATGQTASGEVLNDVWRLDLASETWEDLSASAGPAPAARYGAAGGDFNGSLVITHGFGSTRYDDTWLFDPASGRWENITPAGDVPLRRCLLAAAPTGDRLVLHGGCASGFGDCFLDDTWILDTAVPAWHQVSGAVKPPGRQFQTLTPLADGGQVILFGGQGADQAPMSDLWLLDLASESWQPLAVAEGPPARHSHQAAWIPAAGGLLVFGGRGSDGPLSDVWLLSLP